MNGPLSLSVSIGAERTPASLSEYHQGAWKPVESPSVRWSRRRGLSCLDMRVGEAQWHERTSESTNYSCSFLAFWCLPLCHSDLVTFLVLCVRGFRSQYIGFSLPYGPILDSKLQVSSYVGCSLHLFLEWILSWTIVISIYDFLRFLCLFSQVISLIQCQLDFPRLNFLLIAWPWLCVNLLQHSVSLDAVGIFISILRSPGSFLFVGKTYHFPLVEHIVFGSYRRTIGERC